MGTVTGKRVYVVCQNHALTNHLKHLVGDREFQFREFQSGEALLSVLTRLQPGLAIVGYGLPGMNGLDVLDSVKRARCDMPVILVAYQASIPLAVRAIRLGAVDFLAEPIQPELLQAALALAEERLARGMPRGSRASLSGPLLLLTPRETEVLQHLLDGKQNKAIAHVLGISERTVEVHRARMMRRLNVSSFAELIRLAIACGMDAV